MFTLRFPIEEIPIWAARYPEGDDDALYDDVVPFLRRERYLTKPLFLKLARWKSPRIIHHCASNPEAFVEEATRTALAARQEQIRIGTLTLLQGVGWPMASVILHFSAETEYPILDVRALWSLGIDSPPPYDFPFWWEYTCHIRRIAAETGGTMRQIDRALWQFSKEHQGS